MVMRVWTERQIELRGFYNINLTSTALALLLASRHPALAEIQAASSNTVHMYMNVLLAHIVLEKPHVRWLCLHT